MMIGLLLVSLILVSCKQDNTATSAISEGAAPVSDEVGGNAALTGDDVGQTGDDVADTEADKPEPRKEMAATDPGSVNLGSGRLTLVEFFAFW
jgi:hypothetical protein